MFTMAKNPRGAGNQPQFNGRSWVSGGQPEDLCCGMLGEDEQTLLLWQCHLCFYGHTSLYCKAQDPRVGERTTATPFSIFLLCPEGSPAPQMQPDPTGFVSRREDTHCSLLHVGGSSEPQPEPYLKHISRPGSSRSPDWNRLSTPFWCQSLSLVCKSSYRRFRAM